MTTATPRLLAAAIDCRGSRNHDNVFDAAQIFGFFDDGAVAIQEQRRPTGRGRRQYFAPHALGIERMIGSPHRFDILVLR